MKEKDPNRIKAIGIDVWLLSGSVFYAQTRIPPWQRVDPTRAVVKLSRCTIYAKLPAYDGYTLYEFAVLRHPFIRTTEKFENC